MKTGRGIVLYPPLRTKFWQRGGFGAPNLDAVSLSYNYYVNILDNPSDDNSVLSMIFYVTTHDNYESMILC